MPYYVLENFQGGVDTRRAPFAAPAGSLSMGLNVHITSGGDVEVRKAFVPIATLPDGCFGLEALHNSLYTFGSITPPATMPSGFTYQQLVHPAGLALTGLVDIEPYDGEGFVLAKYGDDVRTFYAGTRLREWDPDRAFFRFSVNDGTADAANKITSITVNAVEVLGAAVLWTTSDENTAALIAAQINTYASSPDYTAYVPSGGIEVVLMSPRGTITTGQPVVLTPAGNMSLSVTSGVMEAPRAPPTSARTVGEKVYVTSGPNLVFSATGDATNFSINSAGGGFINISTHSSGSDNLIGSEIFYDDLTVFASSAAQRWHIESDDSKNVRSQTFRNVTMLGARGCMAYLDGPTFFVSAQGVRAIQTNSLTGRGLARSDSKPIDKSMVAHINSLTPAQQARALMLTEPEEDRMWVCLEERVFVRSWFPGNDAPAWTEYAPGFVIDDYAVLDSRLYLLSGSTVYLYGGTTGGEYEPMDAIVRLPYANLRAPATFKNLTGMDLGIEGEWKVRMSTDPDDIEFTDAVDLGTYTHQTFDAARIPIGAKTPHVSLELRHEKAEFARLSRVVFHYKTDDAN